MALARQSQPQAHERRGANTSKARATRPDGGGPASADQEQVVSGQTTASPVTQRSALSSRSLMRLQRTAGNQAVQRLLRPSPTIARLPDDVPRAGVPTDANTPAGGVVEEPRGGPWLSTADWMQRSIADQPSSLMRQVDGPMRPTASRTTTLPVQRKIGDGHDLKSARLKGDTVLEGVFDNERVLTKGSSGPAVIRVQHALTDLGIRMPKSGIDGAFGNETRTQVKAFQKSESLKDDGIVGFKTIGALDTKLLTGAGGAGPLPSPVPPAPGKAAPTLAAAINAGPAAGTNGLMNFVINWQLGSNAGAKGGFVIQDVLFTWRSLDKKGKDVPNPDPRVSPLRYFEAWKVAPNSKTLTPVTTDTFFWPGSAPWAGNNSKGRVTIAAQAHFFDEVNALPAHMTANNVATFAGILQASLADPALAGPVSGTVAHSLAFHWDSTKVPNSPTVLDAHTP